MYSGPKTLQLRLGLPLSVQRLDHPTGGFLPILSRRGNT